MGQCTRSLRKIQRCSLRKRCSFLSFSHCYYTFTPIFGQIAALFEKIIADAIYAAALKKVPDQKISKKIAEFDKYNKTTITKIEGIINNKIDKNTIEFLSAKNKKQFLEDMLKNDPKKLHLFVKDWVKTLESNIKDLEKYSAMQMDFESFCKFQSLGKSDEFKAKCEMLDDKIVLVMSQFIFQNLSVINNQLEKDLIINSDNLSQILGLIKFHYKDFGNKINSIMFESFFSNSNSKNVESCI